MLNDKDRIFKNLYNDKGVDVDAKFSVAEISEEKYDLSVDFKPRKYVIKPAKEIIETKKKKKKKKKKSIDDEW